MPIHSSFCTYVGEEPLQIFDLSPRLRRGYLSRPDPMLRSPLPRRRAKDFFCQSAYDLRYPLSSSLALNFRVLRAQGRGISTLCHGPLSSGLLPSRPRSHTAIASPSNVGCAFSSTAVAMVAAKIDGTAIAKNIRERLKSEIEEIQKSNPRFIPSLVIFQGRSCRLCGLPRGNEDGQRLYANYVLFIQLAIGLIPVSFASLPEEETG